MLVVDDPKDVRKHTVATRLNDRQLASLTRAARADNVTVSTMLAAMVDWLGECKPASRQRNKITRYVTADEVRASTTRMLTKHRRSLEEPAK